VSELKKGNQGNPLVKLAFSVAGAVAVGVVDEFRRMNEEKKDRKKTDDIEEKIVDQNTGDDNK